MIINEEFTSYQGSGSLAGRHQRFVRLSGCSVPCPIRKQCDQQDALHATGGIEASPDDIVAGAVNSVGRGGFLHITGGEPLDQSEAVIELCGLAKKAGLLTHLQTSGLRRVPVPFDFVTISPKVVADKLVQRKAHELILIAAPWVTFDIAADLHRATRCFSYFVQPLEVDGELDWGRAVELANLLNQCGQNWGLTGQLHKQAGIQ